MSTPRSLSSLLTGHSQLLEHVRYLAELQKHLYTELSDDLAHHCRVQNLRDGTLFLETDGPVWANRLRYLLPSLLQKLQNHADHTPLRGIQISVVPEQFLSASPKRPAKLSASAAQLLLENAKSTADPQLRAALLRLADHIKGQ